MERIQLPAALGSEDGRRAATIARLTELTDWYGKHARLENWSYKGLKVVSISAAAVVTVLAAASGPAMLVASLGAVVVVTEGVQALFQFHTNSVAFSKTKQELRREEALYRAMAGPYARTKDPDRLLAERIEAMAASDLDAWVETQLDEKAK